jgi:hypothetical protein
MCDNKVSYYVPRGYDYKETFVKCGNTDPHGSRAICEKCAADPDEMAAIERHEENTAADNEWLRSAGWGEM